MTSSLRQQLQAAQMGDASAQAQLVEENLPLVHSIVRRFYGRGEPEDLFQLGTIGLMKAIRDFDASRAVEFSTYAVPKIAGEIRRFLRDDGLVKVSRTVKEHALTVYRARQALTESMGESPRLSQLCQATGLTLEQVLEAMQAPVDCLSLEAPMQEDGSALGEFLPGENEEEQLTRRLDIQRALGQLEPRWRQVILLRYMRELTQMRTAQILGMTQVQVSRLEKKALLRLRELLG